MSRRLDRAGDGRDVVHDPRRGIHLHREDRLDLRPGVRPQPIGERLRVDGPPRRRIQHLHLDAEHPGHLAPRFREHAAVRDEHLVATAAAIGERRLPSPVAVRRVDVERAFGAEDSPESGEAGVRHADELFTVDVDGGPVHGDQHFVGHRGGARNGEKLATVPQCHSQWFLWFKRWGKARSPSRRDRRSSVCPRAVRSHRRSS